MFAELNQQLSKTRNLEFETEKRNRDLKHEREEMAIKRQRRELEEQEQKQTEPAYATALEWVQATQPCKEPPPGPPDVLMPSDTYCSKKGDSEDLEAAA